MTRPPNKGMELTSALPRFARWHGRRSQLMPGVRPTVGRTMTRAERGAAVGILAIATVVMGPAPVASAEQAGRVTAASVRIRVERQGAPAALDELSESAQWETILDGIAGGGAGWLRVAAALLPVSDGHSAEDLTAAVSEALGSNPRGVLRLIRSGAATSGVCEWYGFMTQTEAATRSRMQRFVEQRRRLVASVSDTGLKAERVRCLEALDRAERSIDGQLRVP